jgi:hypothetical protein
MRLRNGWTCLAVALLLLATWAMAAPRNTGLQDQANPDALVVDMFPAIENGQIDVKLIPKDVAQFRMVITNKTKQPLSVRLPDAFGAVPVLAQQQPAQQNNNQNQNQAAGGAAGGPMGGGQGFFNVPPEKVGQLKATTVCLEHGKADPRPGVPYMIKPIESVTDNPQVQEVCRLIGRGVCSQRVAQVAAWHLNNHMSWQQLLAKEVRFAGGGSAPYFSPQEIQAAMQLVALTTRIVEQKKLQQPQSTGSPGSLSTN